MFQAHRHDVDVCLEQADVGTNGVRQRENLFACVQICHGKGARLSAFTLFV